MIFARIRGTKEELRSLAHSPVFLQRQAVRKLGGGRFEVIAVMEAPELSLLEINGYDLSVIGEANALLRQRLRPAGKAIFPSSEDYFSSVAGNNAYMTVDYIETWMVNLVSTFPLLAELVTLPNPTWEGRQSHAVRLRAGDPGKRPTVMFTGGVHAAELGGADACIYFLYRLVNAYRNDGAITLGNYSVSSAAVQALLNTIDIYVFPCVNPDGRVYVFDKLDWWRKNRNPNVGMGAVGVDINRNYDFLWSSGIGSSLLPQDDTYRGAAPFSEPETRNVDWLLRQSAAGAYMDIHGPSGCLLYTWGDAANQSFDASMNFRNPQWDGRRYNPYGEYLSDSDVAYIQAVGARVAAAVNSVRAGGYDSEPSFSELYPTTATSDDYAFSRHLLDAAQNKTWAYTFEFGGADFFPPYPDMLPLIAETNTAMLEFCAAAMVAAPPKATTD